MQIMTSQSGALALAALPRAGGGTQPAFPRADCAGPVLESSAPAQLNMPLHPAGDTGIEPGSSAQPMAPQERRALGPSDALDPLHLYADAMQHLQQLDGALLQRYHWIVALICRVGGADVDDQAEPARPLLGATRQPEALLGLTRDIQHLEVRWDELLRCASPVSGRPYAEQMAGLRTLADAYISQAQALRQRCWQALTLRDALTGALNPQWLDATLQTERERSERAGLPCLLLLADHDDFSRVNEQWGRLVGDLVLAHVGRLLREDLRHSDFLFRLGGDRWLILLPCSQSEHGQAVQQRLLNKLEANPLDFGGGQRIALRLSMGQAAARCGETQSTWISRAAAKLRQNRVAAGADPEHRP